MARVRAPNWYSSVNPLQSLELDTVFKRFSRLERVIVTNSFILKTKNNSFDDEEYFVFPPIILRIKISPIC